MRYLSVNTTVSFAKTTTAADPSASNPTALWIRWQMLARMGLLLLRLLLLLGLRNMAHHLGPCIRFTRCRSIIW